jgi:hypothetical protein
MLLPRILAALRIHNRLETPALATTHIPDSTGTSCVSEQYTLSLQTDPAQQIEPSGSARVIAKVINTLTGQPKEGVTVSIKVDVDVTSGGHDHGERIPPRPKGALSPATGTTGPDGTVSFNFGAPEVSGSHTFAAKCISPACANEGAARMDVKVDGLATIPSSQFYTLTEPDGRGGIKVIGDNGNHSGNHYLTSDAASQLWRLAATYYFKYRQDTSVPLLHLNDASLIWGGRFDINGNWADPHAGHRKGTVIDIRANALPTAIPTGLLKDFKKLCDKTLLADGVTSAIAQLHFIGLPTQHYHVLLLGVDQ